MIFFNTVKCPSAAPCNYYDDWLIHMHLWKEQLKCKEKQGNRWPHHCIHSDEKFHRLTDEIFSHPSTSATQTLFTPHHVCLWLWQPDNPQTIQNPSYLGAATFSIKQLGQKMQSHLIVQSGSNLIARIVLPGPAG